MFGQEFRIVASLFKLRLAAVICIDAFVCVGSGSAILLGAKLELRHTQSLVITPQLQQAIKLLQLSNLELQSFLEREIEQNPLIEWDERTGEEGARLNGASLDAVPDPLVRNEADGPDFSL